MSFMIVPEPLFNKDMAVQAYRLRTFDCDKLMGIQDDFRKMDEAFSNPGLNMVEQIGIAPLTGGKKLFAEISHVQLMTGIPKNLKIRPEQLVCVLPHDAFHEQSTVSALVPLREMGYEFALSAHGNYQKKSLEEASDLIQYVVLDYTQSYFPDWYRGVKQTLQNVRTVICDVPNVKALNAFDADSTAYFSGEYYQLPVEKSNAAMSPVKINSLQLLKQVNKDDFELSEISKIIERDPYLTVSLLRYVRSEISGINREITSSKQAVAILGQKAIKRWATIALSMNLGADGPSEITRLALLRARFAEELAPIFELGAFQNSLFLMGLFSLLDVMLDKPMKLAIREIAVEDRVKQALVDRKGPFAPVLEAIAAYERANWSALSIILIHNNADMKRVSQAYISSLMWYKSMLDSIKSDAKDKSHA